MAQAGQVTALLQLDASGFNTSIKNSADKVTQFAKTMEKVGKDSTSFTDGIRTLVNELSTLRTTFNELANMSSFTQFKNLSEGMNNMVNAAIKFNKEGSVTVGTFQQMGNAVRSFMDALGGVEVKLTNVVRTTQQLVQSNNTTKQSLYNVDAEFNKMSNDLLRLSGVITEEASKVKILDGAFKMTASTARQVENEFNRLYINILETANAIGSYDRQVLRMNEGFYQTTANLEKLGSSALQAFNDFRVLTQGVEAFNKVSTTSPKVNFSGTVSTLKEVEAMMNKTGESAKRMSSNIVSSSNSASTAKQRFNGLTQALGGLRTMVSMVGSMFIYNFAFGLMQSVQNTVKAKSEMLSFLHTMGMTQSQISSFNNALDQTAERFQRINKYNIGETVANIGLEFNLSAKEMEKAMSVTSMVTSEYLRAGRNADEAALAVKDIMQGQFQRLSRETGVKGEQLKEAGWSGETDDVLGLLDALEKVGKARHWDIFAEKASSLNDILLITQNRLSEWATDISEGIVPMVTGSFNILVSVVDKVTAFFSGLGQALHLPDWSGTAVIIGGLAAAMGVLLTSTITLRTGMGLLQIANQGLGQSILAAIFNIKAEELANVNATTAIKAKILGVQAETMANQGLTNILKAKILGLDAEIVAQDGVSAAIEHKLMVQRQEEIQNEKNTASNISLLESYVSLKTGIEASEMEGLKWHQKLALLNKEVDVADAKNLKFHQSLRKMVSSLNAAKVASKGLQVALVALAAAMVLNYAAGVSKSVGVMKEFNEMVNDGDDKIRKMKNAFGENSEQAKNMTEAVEKARSAQDKYNKSLAESADRSSRWIAKLSEGKGMNDETLKELASSSLSLSREGVSQLAHASEEIDHIYKGSADTYALMNDKVLALRGSEGLAEYARDLELSSARIATAYEKMTLSDSMMDRFFGWIDYTGEQLGHWWSEFSINLESQDWGAAWENIWKGFMRGFSNLPIASDIWKTLSKAVFGDALKEFKGSGDLQGALDKLVHLPFEWIMEGAKKTANSDFIVKGMGEFFKGIEDGFKSFIDNFKLPSLDELFGKLFSGGEGGSGLAKKINPMGLLKNIFGNIDASSITDYLNNNLLTPLTDFFSSFSFDDFFANLGSFFTTGGLIGKILGLGGDTDIGAMFGEYLGIAQQYITDFVTNLTTPFINLPITIGIYLSQIITNITSFASQLLTNGLNAGSNFLNGVVTHISQLPGRVLSFITSTAHNIISGASQWASNARSKAVETVNAVVTQVSQLPGKVYEEFMKIAQRIRDAISGAVQAALQFGSDVVNAVLSALHIHSPGIIQEKIATEFANIPGRIAENTSNAGQQAQMFGEGIVSGFETQLPVIQQQAQAMTDAMNVSANSQAIDFSGQFVGDYQADANTITGLNQVMTTDTAMTFGMMGETVNSTISGISTNLQTSYLNMNTSQTTALTTMQNQNKTAYTNLQNQTTTSLNNMRSTTQNVTVQMTNAWNHMKDNIIASANQLKTQSTAHFNTLSNHIGNFYRKLQNPSMWGGGDKVPTRYYNASRGRRGIQAVKQTFGITPPRKGVAGGPSPENLPEYMKLRKLKSLLGSSSIFDGMDLDQEVNVRDFLSQFDGAFGWNNWHPAHFGKIKNTSGEWNMRGPQIMHRIDTGETFKVKEFYNSQPSISFSSFQHMAEALFSAIPYEFYYNSEGHGSWQAALQAGSCNCYDGANALIALAATCGFSGHTQSGTWNGIPHIYAVINGKKMDTTGWQQRRDWNGVSAGSPPNYKPTSGGDKVTNVTIDMSGTTVYGMDDFEGMMEEVAQRVLGEEVNTSITLGI